MPQQGLSKCPKELSGACLWCLVPLQEENLPEMGGNPKPYPCPGPQGPAASFQNEYCLCALGCLRGLPSNRFFPGGTAKGSLGDEAGVAKLPPAPVRRAAGTRDTRRQVPLAAAPSSVRLSRTVARPPPRPLPSSLQPEGEALARRGARGVGWAGDVSPWPVPPSAWDSDRRLCRSSWLGLGARRLRQLMEHGLVPGRRSKVPAFCRGRGAGGQAPPLKGSRGVEWGGMRLVRKTLERPSLSS